MLVSAFTFYECFSGRLVAKSKLSNGYIRLTLPFENKFFTKNKTMTVFLWDEILLCADESNKRGLRLKLRLQDMGIPALFTDMPIYRYVVFSAMFYLFISFSEHVRMHITLIDQPIYS